MAMRKRASLAIALVVFLLSGCAQAEQETSVPPVSTMQTQAQTLPPVETTLATQPVSTEPPPTEEVVEEEPWYLRHRLVRHACGEYNGAHYTNSREAMEHSLETGHRLIEVDFLVTTDDQLVCAHTWKDIFPHGCAGTLEACLKRNPYREYTLLTGADIISYMQAYPDLYIIVDTKQKDLTGVVSLLVELAQEPQIVDRLILQVYWPGEKTSLLELYPFPRDNILFTAYKFGTNRVSEILRLCQQEDIPVVTSFWSRYGQDTVKRFSEAGVLIFEHTVNTPEALESSLERGVRGVYSDSLQLEDFPEPEAPEGQS